MKPVWLYPGAPTLSRICLGASTFGREIDEPAAFALMDYARVRGITLFDTAAMYSDGASEKIVGHWLKWHRPEPGSLMVATKIYPPYTAEAMNAALAASAERLGVPVIDVLYLHKWDASVEKPECLQTLDQFVRSGRVRSLGASNFTPAQLRTALESQQQLGFAAFRILQNNNNLAIRDVDDALLMICAKHEVTIVTYSPLGAGFLTGKHRGGVQPGSRFDTAPSHQEVYFNPQAAQQLALLMAVAARTGHSMTHLALAWALHHEGVASVIVGGRKPAHVDQAFAALVINERAIFAELESV